VIIVAGWLRVSPEDRGPYLETCREVILAARSAEGCIDFHISADALDGGRINIFEQWKSAEAVDAFRGSGPSDDQQAMIMDAHVEQHEIVSTTSLT
jgi:quinol monooxygenase YgiN